jgi:hypothetical protein
MNNEINTAPQEQKEQHTILNYHPQSAKKVPFKEF